MTDYNAIQLGLERAIAALQEDLEFLRLVKADQNIIDTLQGDILAIDKASEIVWQYRELES